MEEPSTQLADTRPILDKPLRVAIPVNVPSRNSIPNRDEVIYHNTFSPMAIQKSFFQFYHNNFKSSLRSSSLAKNGATQPLEADPRLINITEKVDLHKIELPTASAKVSSSSSSGKGGNDKKSTAGTTKDINQLIPMNHDASQKNQLTDYSLLAVSSKRANKKDVEAMAYASLGVLYDNQEDYLSAIHYYSLYLAICEELQDTIGIASAYNAIGIDYMLLSNPLLEKSEIFNSFLINLQQKEAEERAIQQELLQQQGISLNTIHEAFDKATNSHHHTTTGGNISPTTQLDGGNTFNGTGTANTNNNNNSTMRKKTYNSSKPLSSHEIVGYLEKAIEFHGKHSDISPDLGGKFIANANLGICYFWLNTISQSAVHFQESLKVAIKMQTLFGQSIAVGNLGLLAFFKKDFLTARTCFDQHLQLIQALMDPEAEINAWILLADLCNAQENYSNALDNLDEARKIAEKERFLNDLRRIHCLIGIAKGTNQFLDYTRSLAYH